MAKGRFWIVTGSIIVILFKFSWTCILFTFVVLPRLLILPIRRAIAQSRTKRLLIKQGMPKEEAKIYAKKFRNMLYEYSSIRGMSNLAKNYTKKSKEEDLDIIESKKNLTKIKSFSLLSI